MKLSEKEAPDKTHGPFIFDLAFIAGTVMFIFCLAMAFAAMLGVDTLIDQYLPLPAARFVAWGAATIAYFLMWSGARSFLNMIFRRR